VDTGVDIAATDLPADTGVDTAATDLPADVGTDTAASSVLPSETDSAADVTGATGAVGVSDFDQYSGMGFVDIPVEQIMSACESEPQARVADLLQREIGIGGTTAQ
jgi:hypothetical protein